MEHIMTVVDRVPPIELFHYTDFSGLIGLVSNKQIWMGDLFFLNDEKEYQLGLELLNVIKSIKVGPNPNKELCQNSIYSLLNVSNLHHVNVSLSSIPYRN